jgi:predicted transcriptional regulator of viral defense system
MINKLSLLLKSKQILFHAHDLALLWGITNRQTLRITISRYVKKGILKSVFKGLYSTVSINELDKFQLGMSLIHKFCYVSLESIFEMNGVINQKVYSVNFVTSVSKKIEFNETSFVYRQMDSNFLFNPEGIVLENGIYKASLERAVADSDYFNLNIYFDSPDLINWNRVAEIKAIIGY